MKVIYGIAAIAGLIIAGPSFAAQSSEAKVLMQQEHNVKAEQKKQDKQELKGGRPEGVSNPKALSSK